MKEKQVELKNDDKQFERFDDLFRQVVSVSKDELKRREEIHQQAKKKKKY